MFYWKEALGGLDSHGPQQEDSGNMWRWMFLPPPLPDQVDVVMPILFKRRRSDEPDSLSYSRPSKTSFLPLFYRDAGHSLLSRLRYTRGDKAKGKFLNCGHDKISRNLSRLLLQLHCTPLSVFLMLQPRWPLFVPWSCWGQLSRTLQLLLCLENLPFRALSWSTVTTQVVTQRHQSLSLLSSPLFSFFQSF